MPAPPSPQRPETAGLIFLAVTALGWGLNWPIMKRLLEELPPLSARGWAGFAAALGLALGARAVAGASLSVPRALWLPLVVTTLCNVTAWMGLATVGLLWLSAAEGTITAYTMPVWTALLAWPVLGERPSARRLVALALGLGGLVTLVAGQGLALGLAKLPGVALVLAGAVLFALGTVLTKRRPLGLPPPVLAAWQVGLGCVPLALAGLLLERPDFAALSGRGWAAMAYMAAVPLGLCYLTWFAALRRLPAGLAALGTLATPCVGVLAAAAMLGEPLTAGVVLALSLTLGGILLAIRS